MYTSTMIRTMNNNAHTFAPNPRSYVVVVPVKGRNGRSERVAYGLGYSLTERAAKRLARAITGMYSGGKPRAIMVKTAVKDGILG